jgi:FKBP-type peptidyl-prolyl cis-trans isomerase SlyD
MKITNDVMVSLQYIVKDKEGKEIESSQPGQDMQYIHGTGSIIRGLEMELEGHEDGDQFDASIAAADAYGAYDSELLSTYPKDSLPPQLEVEVGMVLQASDGYGQPRLVTITEVKDTEVVIDANHPMAGKDLTFSITVNTVREATTQELAALHAGSDGGCGCPSCGTGSCDSDYDGGGSCGSGGGCG